EEPAAEAAETLTATKPGYDNLDVTVSLTKAADGTVGSLTVDASTQTPGLGQRCAEEAFTSQFVGKTAPFVLGENVDAVASATLTSTAVVDAVNELMAGAPAAEEPAAEPAAGAVEALTATKPGYDNLDVTVSLTKAADGTVGSLTVDASTQTPGLGQRCAEEAFTSQFVGKTAPFVLGENVDAVASATLTSTAVVDAVNELMAGAPAAEEPAAEPAAEEPAAETAETLTATKPGYDNLDVTVSLTKAADGTVASLTVDASTQTPGLGQRCAEEAFTSQFVGKTAPFVLGENVDAVASATLTSTAVVDAVNERMAGAPAAEEPAAEPAAEEPAAEAAETLTATKPGYDNLDVTVSLTKAADGTVASLTVDASTQTPGLGQRCAEEAFTSQFVGKTAPFVLGENVDAVASATLTSTAVVDAVNELMAGAPAAEEPAAEPAAEEPAVEEPAPEVTAVPADLGEVYSITKPGFGELPLTVSITKAEDGTVTSLTVDASIQTAAIGDRVADTAFTSQFIGKTGPFVLGENVDAMAGATISSAAVVDAVNELLAAPAGEAAVQETPVPEDLGEVYTITKPGFGELPVTVSLTKSDDGTVTSLTVDASVQTAGIGDRVADTAFTSQFVGKTGPFVLGENIDALAGATLTSSAVVEAVNELLGLLPEATEAPTPEPTAEPTPVPTAAPTAEPTQEPTAAPDPTEAPTATPAPTEAPIVPEVGEDGTLTATVPGFGGLPLVVSLKKAEDGTVAALTIDASAQTAGIGDRCSDEAFTGQFVGKTAPFAIGENIDAVAGATVTSTAVVKAVNALMDYTSGN
ncbi:MAG: FMN-binding protein, partial [Clostridia bacterium]|nr:FMN-binding protein [Clostridia bacterium]